MHTVFYKYSYVRIRKQKFSKLKRVPQTSLYEVFECNDIIETTAAYFFKKFRWLS